MNNIEQQNRITAFRKYRNEYMKKWRQTPKGKEYFRNYFKKYKKEHRDELNLKYKQSMKTDLSFKKKDWLQLKQTLF